MPQAENGDCLTELRLLAETAGAQVRGEVLQRRGPVRASTFLSKGKTDRFANASFAARHQRVLVI